MTRILVVEDEELIGAMVAMNLESEGFETQHVADAETMLTTLERRRFDLIVLDIMLPGIQGDAALRQIRRQGHNLPVIMLTARDDLPTKVATLESGADDYLAKPFDMGELLARCKALIRRSQGSRALPASGTVTVGGFEVNLRTRQADTTEGALVLSEKEMRLITYFLENPREPLSRLDILEEVWGMDVNPTPRTVDNFIVRLRKLFEADPDTPRHFVTVRGLGYRYEP